MEQLSFLNEHAAVDFGHTALNERMMEEAITPEPAQARRLADIGSRGLDCYLRVLGDCLSAAQGTWTPLSAAA
jgi:hypothetical protein